VAFPGVASRKVEWQVRLGQRLRWFAISNLSLTGGHTNHTESDDEAAQHFDAFFREQEPRIYGYLWRITGDRQLASDLCQETFLRAWNSFAKVRGYENQTAWLLRVATNLTLNSRRRGNTRIGTLLTLDETIEPSVSSDHAGQIAEQDAVHRVLLTLPVPMRAALVLREVEGLPYSEVSRLLGMRPGATRMLLSRAREQFRRCYRREEEQQ
jgi:RNA polymerase sigma-70 factor (ECF subfamily)